MSSFPDRLRNRSHTGERRCWPCTAVNAAILLAFVGVARRRSRALAALVGGVGTALIALRGYLVPYTPRFAPRLVSYLPGDPFGTAHAAGPPGPRETPDASDSLGDDEADGERVLSALVDRGVVVADGETVRLDDGFREAWRAEMRDLRARDDAALADALDAVAPDGLVVEAVEPRGDPWFVVSDGSGDPARENWLSRPVSVAEIGAVRALADRTDLPADLRARAAGPLRTLLESCPACDGPVEETTAMACCGGPGGARAEPDEVLACADCGARLYTFG